MKRCLLCGSEIDRGLIKYEEETSGEPFKEGYCSSQCKETDEMVLRADCEDDNV